MDGMLMVLVAALLAWVVVLNGRVRRLERREQHIVRALEAAQTLMESQIVAGEIAHESVYQRNGTGRRDSETVQR